MGTPRIINGERRYGVWAGKPNGSPEDPSHCVEQVYSNDRSAQFYQCNRKRGHGPDGLYCGPHAEQFLLEPIATWYYTKEHSWEVVPVPVYKETGDTLTVKQGSNLSKTKKRGYYDYWPTREAAIEHLQRRLEGKRAALARDEEEFRKLLES